MKHYKYYMMCTAAALAFAVYASNDMRRSSIATDSKVKPSAELLKATAVTGSSSTVVGNTSRPVFKLSGSADGIPYGLTLNGIADKQVSLEWISPEATDGYFEDFESHTDFAINSPGSIGWTYVDADNKYTYTWSACSFPNMGQKMAYIVMNPSLTSPATDGNPNYQPVSGKKMLVDFCSIDAPNNDYIISPRLTFARDFHFSFMARSYKGGSMPLERIRVGYSTSGMQPSNFTFVNNGDYIELPAEWNLYSFTIPKEARYVTINCVSDDAFMLMIDDIFIGTNNVRPGIAPLKIASATDDVHLQGFNVYRDGERVNDSPITAIRYTDTVPQYDNYTYTVTAIYSDGSESAPSEGLAVNVPDIRLLPFTDDFSDWTLHEEKWTVVNHDNDESKRWSVDYFVYGLVNPAATYHYSSITDYNQSLVSRELHTLDRNSTWLRFCLMLQNYRTYNLDYLTVEVTSDGGATWKEITTFDNSHGSFDRTLFQYPLGELLDADLFSIRFRAHGAVATYIDYWYVDDVKIWNPIWTQATISVISADGPVANCPVHITGDSGADINVVSDASGNISLPQIEEGSYTVTVSQDGYNAYSSRWEVLPSNANTLTVRLTRPIADLSSTSVIADMLTEHTLTRELTLTNSGDGMLSWYLGKSSSATSGNTADRWRVQRTFHASGDLQNAIGYDGSHYYTTSSVTLGEFWKYDTEGNFIEKFSIPGMYYKLYDLTYDGRYFYGSDYSNRLFRLDFVNRSIAGIITVNDDTGLSITHCSYDADLDGFWFGSWNSLGFMKSDGTVVRPLSAFDASRSLSVYGSAYDNVSEGGPYLWLADEETADENSLDCIQILQYSLRTMSLTGVTHLASDVPGYKIGDASMGRNYICGITTSPDVEDGTLSLIGILQQSPSLVFSYKLCDADNWLSFHPKRGILAPGERQTITASFDSRHAAAGDCFNAHASLLTVPHLPEQSVTFTLNATAMTDVPRPIALSAVSGNASVYLSWQPGNPENTPAGYNIYRNGVKVNDSPITECSYTDTHLVYGSYSYTVKALYDGGRMSIESDSITAFVKQGAPYYAPLRLTSSLSLNRLVSLSWESPLADADNTATLSWSSGEHADQIGLYEGGYFYAASVWEPTDLTPYRHKTISSVSVQLVNQCTFLALRILKDGELIYRKTYSGTILYDGTYTDIPVETPLTIEPGCTYHFVLQIMNDANVMPLGIDGTTAVNGKGNALSFDCTEWFPATQLGIGGNFNIRVNLSPSSSISDIEQAPSSYRIWRDGVCIGSSAITSASDTLTVPGIHNYSVTSVYADGGESAPGNSTSVNIVAINGRYAPHTVNANVHINRYVTLRWNYPTSSEPVFPADVTSRPATATVSIPEYVYSFEGTTGEMAVATDNRYIYTSSYSDNGRINRYSLDGTFLETFVIAGLEGVRNLTYDGEYFYATDNLNDIKKIDMELHTVIETVAVSEYARHIAYIPSADGGKGGFEVGDWQTSILVSRNGSKLGDGPALLGAAGTAYHDGKLYAFEQGAGSDACTIGVYDLSTGVRTDEISLSRYAELSLDESFTAGGMSSFTTPEGITCLALALQNNGNTRFVFLELNSIPGVAGYNVLRDGERINSELLTRRSFADTLTTEGTYNYSVETVYIDGTVSACSSPTPVVIVPVGIAVPPANLRASQLSYGYNVLLSFADPDLYTIADKGTGFEGTDSGNDDTFVADYGLWNTTDERTYDGSRAITASASDDATMLISAAGMSHLRMTVCNKDDHKGNGSVDVLCSSSGTSTADFILLGSYVTSEQWRELTLALPEGTDYVAVRKRQGVQPQFIDAVRLFSSAPADRVYAYDIYRDGERINDEPVHNVGYTDRNLLPGHYTYQARLVTVTSAVSDLCAPAEIDLSYDNGGLPPTNLAARLNNDGSIRLSWQEPALGTPIQLRWHSGNSYDAAGLPSGGAFFAGVRWSASDLQDYQQLVVSDIEFYINQLPDALFVLIYEGGTLVRQQYVSGLKQYSFNSVRLDNPLTLDTSKELRIVLYVEHNEISVPLGYDEGPAKEGRGNLYSSDGVTWTTLSSDEVGIDANWNISVGLSPYSTSPSSATVAPFSVAMYEQGVTDVLEGYHVYRNGERLTDKCLSSTAYLDTIPYSGRYLEYKVSAVYSLSGESFSDGITIVGSGVHATDNGESLHVSVVPGAIIVSGVPHGSALTLFNISGTAVYRGFALDSSERIKTATMPAGTYVLQVSGETFKLVVK